MDAHLIEFRRVSEELLREDSLGYERRLRRWSSIECRATISRNMS